MTNKKTYQLFNEGIRELVFEAVLNKNGQVVTYKDHKSSNQTEGLNEYNSSGLLMKEIEINDGEEGSRIEYIYNAKGDLINRKIFVVGELFEEFFIEYLEKGIIERTIQYDEEVKRFVENKEGHNFTREYFEDSELIEKHNGCYNPKTQTSKIEVVDKKGKLLAHKYEEFDKTGHLIKFEEKSKKGNLLILSEYEYENGKVILEKTNNHSTGQHYVMHYEYDANNNLVSQERSTPSEKLLEYQKWVFDNQNRPIGENGHSAGNFNAVYGNHTEGKKYTFEHVYEEK